MKRKEKGIQHGALSSQFTLDEAWGIVSFFHNHSEFCLYHFRREDISKFPSLETELKTLDRIFTDYFGLGEYRNLRDIIILACAMRLSAVRVEAKPMAPLLPRSTINLLDGLHHDRELTPLIMSQFPSKKEDDFFFGKKYYDLVVYNIAVEVGDCRVSKVPEALKEGMDLWVIPEPFDTIYVFTKGRSWRSLERLENRIADDVRKRLEECDSKTGW